MTIDPRLLTGANLRQKQQTNASRGRAAAGAVKKSQAYKGVLQRATAKYGAAYANKVYGAQFQGALAAERRARGAYGQIHSQLGDFQKSYNQLAGLDKANPALQGVLDKLMPFDPQGASDRIGAQQTLNQRLLAIKQGRDQLAEDYSTGVRNLETEEPNRMRALLGNFAGRGLAFSSGYGNALGQEQQDYTRQRTGLDTGNQRGQAAAALDTGAAQSDFQSRLASILFGTTSRLSEGAGQLGMAGNTDLPLLLELARRRLTSGAAAG